MTKVLLADDHTVVRNGLRLLLEAVKGIKVVGEASDGREAIKKTIELAPDVVVMDVAMPKLNGIEAAKRLADECKFARVIMLSMHADEEYVSAALAAGIVGYVLKHEAFTQLLAAIQSVQAGGVFLSPSLTKNKLSDYCKISHTGEPAMAIDRISPREREILQLIAEGNANAEIARMLGLSVRTVESHRAKIMEKLRIFTTAGLTRFAIRHRMVALEQ